jgi:hypothetical protein
MNERIRELAEQAGVFAGDFAGAGIYSIHNKDEVEAFAELIVGECAKIVEDSTWNLPHGYKTVDQANLVKQHFGVKK